MVYLFEVREWVNEINLNVHLIIIYLIKLELNIITKGVSLGRVDPAEGS